MVELREGTLEKLRKCKIFILDIDGTFYVSKQVFPESWKFVKKMDEQGKKIIFYTNNSNLTIDNYIKEFKSFGYSLGKDEIYTAGVLAAEFLFNKYGSMRLFIVGTSDIISEFRKAGHVIDDRDPEAVICTFDKELTYWKIARACQLVGKGKKFIITNPNLTCPNTNGLIPDTASIASVITSVVGRKPDYVFGKPNPDSVKYILEKIGVKPEESCVVGDTLTTDILLGINSSILSILVLTGECGFEDVRKSGIVPDIVAKDLGEVADYM